MSASSLQGSTSVGRGGENGAEETKEGGIPAQVLEARKYAIDSAIVRVMKARKSLSHNDLIAEVTHQLTGRFSASPQVQSFIYKRFVVIMRINTRCPTDA